MKTYRIKHIPTGLYYCPSRHVRVDGLRYTKSNLSKRGKIYTQKPSLKWLGDNIYSHLVSGKDVLVPHIETDWQIEEL